MTVAWRRSKLARKEPARVLRGESTWAATPLAVLPTPEVYEAEKARILGGTQ